MKIKKIVFYKVKTLLHSVKYVQKFGFLTGTQIFLKLFFSLKNVYLAVPGYAHPIVVRPYTSDIWVFKQIFVDEDFKGDFHKNPKAIIDAGANVGYTTVYFAKKYPGAKIIAIEPEDSNFEMLCKNTENYDQVQLMHSAIWYKDCYIRIMNPEAGSWGFIIEEVSKNTQGAFEAITFDHIIKESGFKRVDILKIDIEGSEKEIFENNPSWISIIDVVCIELHDYHKKGCEKAVFEAMKGFNKKKQGPNYIFTKR